MLQVPPLAAQVPPLAPHSLSKINVFITGKRDINALHVKCTNVDRGCEWEGTVGTLKEHMCTCQLTLLLCPKQCKDDENQVKQFMRKDLNRHLEKDCPNRDCECKYCGEKGRMKYITKIHVENCKKKILPCPNAECTDTMERQGIKRHLEDCVYTEVNCKYQKLGCDVKMKRNVLSTHECADRLHFHMALDTIVAMETTVLKNGESMTFEIAEFQKKKDDNAAFLSPTFYTSLNGYHMRVKVYVNGSGDGKGTHLSVFVHILKGKHDDYLSWPFLGKVNFSLLNQVSDSGHVEQLISFTKDMNASVGCSRGFRKFIPHNMLPYNSLHDTQYIKDDKLYFRVKVKVDDHKPWLECTVK